jgi:4-hydroxy-3-methylbut-2-en-1-yl diphosphate synthase IspG/GcpE
MQNHGMPEEYRDLVICNSCLWAASLLKGSRGFIACPACGNISLDIIPVSDYEKYTMKIRDKSVELKFKKDT